LLVGPAIPPSVDPFRMSVDLSSFNLEFRGGDYFAIHFTNSDPSGGLVGTGIGILGDLRSGRGPYPAGQAFIRNSEQNGGEWFAWQSPTEQVDFGFVTYVDVIVPEPTALVLAASSLLGLLTARSRYVA